MKTILLTLLLPAFLVADDWPQWRGPDRDGVWKEDGLIDRFSAPQIPIKWRVDIGGGYAGPTVAEGRVYVFDRMRNPDRERILCVDEQTGKKIWSHVYPCSYASVKYPAGPRASVTVHKGLAYALGSTGWFHILDAANGAVRYAADLQKAYNIKMPIWGISGAPLIHEDRVIMQIGGKEACVIALDRKTGKDAWTALTDPASYAAPLLIHQGGKPVVAVWTGTRIVGLDPATGREYWAEEVGYTKWVIGMASPVLHKDRLLVSSNDRGSMMLKLTTAADRSPRAEKLWHVFGSGEDDTKSLHGFISNPVMDDGHFYGVNKMGVFRCIDASNGERVWSDKTATSQVRFSCLHTVRNGDRYWMFNDRGELIIARLSSKGYEEISRAKLIEPTELQLRRRGGVTWAHPAFANRHVFARSDEALVCASLAKP